MSTQVEDVGAKKAMYAGLGVDRQRIVDSLDVVPIAHDFEISMKKLAEESPGSFVSRGREYRARRGGFDNPPGVHEHDTIGDIPREPQLVRDADHRHPVVSEFDQARGGRNASNLKVIAAVSACRDESEQYVATRSARCNSRFQNRHRSR